MTQTQKQAENEIREVTEVGGYVTANRACAIINDSGNYQDEQGQVKNCSQATLGYWLRNSVIDGVRLEGNILVSKKSVTDFAKVELPKRNQEAIAKAQKANREKLIREKHAAQMKALREQMQAEIDALGSQE